MGLLAITPAQSRCSILGDRLGGAQAQDWDWMESGGTLHERSLVGGPQRSSPSPQAVVQRRWGTL